jgi:hypothetical protein
MKTRILILIILSVFIMPEVVPTAAQEPTWHVEPPVSLSEALDGMKISSAQVYIAPDGRHVAYGSPGRNAVCTLDIPKRQEQCVSVPTDSGYSFPLVETDEDLVTALYLIDVSSGNRAFIGHLPQEYAPPFVAA